VSYLEAMKSDSGDVGAEGITEAMNQYMELEHHKLQVEAQRLDSIKEAIIDDQSKTKSEIPRRKHSENILLTTVLTQLAVNPSPLTNQRILEYERGLGHTKIDLNERGEEIEILCGDVKNEIICSPALKLFVMEMRTSYRAADGQGIKGYIEMMKAHLMKQSWEELLEEKEARGSRRRGERV